MLRTLFKSKIHRATVTQADLHYVGSVTIDADLLDAADLLPGELVHIVDITNGARLETYVIEGERGSGVIGINGAAAHLVHPGDLVIIISYAQVTDAEARALEPRVVHVDRDNRVVALGADPSEPVPGSTRSAARRRCRPDLLDDLRTRSVPMSDIEIRDDRQAGRLEALGPGEAKSSATSSTSSSNRPGAPWSRSTPSWNRPTRGRASRAPWPASSTASRLARASLSPRSARTSSSGPNATPTRPPRRARSCSARRRSGWRPTPRASDPRAHPGDCGCRPGVRGGVVQSPRRPTGRRTS